MRYEMTDLEWSIIRTVLPANSRGIPRVDDRRVLNGTFWILRSGAPWRDLSDRDRIDFTAVAGLRDGAFPPF